MSDSAFGIIYVIVVIWALVDRYWIYPRIVDELINDQTKSILETMKCSDCGSRRILIKGEK